MTSEEHENNSTNQKGGSSQRRGELRRGFTIDTGQENLPDREKEKEREEGRRISFQRPQGTMEYRVESRDTLNSIALKFDTTPNKLVTINKLFSRAVVPGKMGKESGSVQVHPRRSNVVLSTTEEEEDLTERFLKISCKYITDGKGIVGGVLLVTPGSLLFDPDKRDPLVQQRGCEEYGVMAPLEEVMSVAMCSEVTDPWVKGQVPDDLELPAGDPEPSLIRQLSRSNLEDWALQAESTEASLSEDIFTDSQLDQPDQTDQPSTDTTHHTHSAQDNTSQELPALGHTARRDPGLTLASMSASTAREVGPGPGQKVEDSEGCGGEKLPEGNAPSSDSHTPCTDSHAPSSDSHAPSSDSHAPSSDSHAPSSDSHADLHTTSESQGSDTPAAGVCIKGYDSQALHPVPPPAQDSQSDMDELRRLWSTHTMPSANEQGDGGQLTASKGTVGNQEQSERKAGSEGPQLPLERRRQSRMRFLRVCVSRPMKKTFVSQASASMQQYAQRHQKHSYWFTVPPQRSGLSAEGGVGGFVLVKRTSDQTPLPDITSKDWEVVSEAEYQRRIDALNSEDLRALCRRLQITTKEEASQRHGAAVRVDLESEDFRPILSDPSDLLTSDQLQKLAKHLPPRTIGYPWRLAFSTSKHGMSIKALYRSMASLDTPILMVVRDTDRRVFGALASEPLKVSDGFYGTGETFLFTFCPEFEVFMWTGDNMFFFKGDMDSLAFGGGGGFGLWLDGDLYHGRSNPCKTFGNPCLSQKEDFVLQDIEIWAFE
ncbi:oxidation resistance protein 1-like [Polymixia lowei]